MSRQLRRDHGGAIQHVMVRSLPELPLLFRDDDDRRSFTLRLARVAEEEHYRVLAVALMPNHAHIVGQTGPTPLWCVMKRLISGYASTFNRKYTRRGYVLQDRYRSKLVSTREYLETVICYVLLNPLRGGVVHSLAELERFPWTSLPALLGTGFPLFTEVGATLEVFGDSRRAARYALRERLRAIVAAGPIAPLTFDRDSGDDLSSIQREDDVGRFARAQLERSSEGWRRARRLRAVLSVDDIIRIACAATGTTPSQLQLRDRDAFVSDARALAAHLLVDDLEMRATDAATVVGLRRSGMSKAIRRGRTCAIELGVKLDVDSHDVVPSAALSRASGVMPLIPWCGRLRL